MIRVYLYSLLVRWWIFWRHETDFAYNIATRFFFFFQLIIYTVLINFLLLNAPIRFECCHHWCTQLFVVRGTPRNSFTEITPDRVFSRGASRGRDVFIQRGCTLFIFPPLTLETFVPAAIVPRHNTGVYPEFADRFFYVFRPIFAVQARYW